MEPCSAIRIGVRLTFDGNYNDAAYTRAPSLPALAELSYNGAADIDAKGQLAAPSGAGVTAYLGRTVNYNQPARYGITLRAKY
ncbi:MAG TPA: hypothetical protein VF637_16905 [Sphingomicrobium sp.]